jgi:hypothetical protein
VTTDFFGIAFRPGETVIVGARGEVFSSADLSQWELQFTGNYGSYRDIAFNGSQYLASGTLLMVSNDGRTWETQIAPIDGTLVSAAYGNGRWVLASDFNTGQEPLTTSANGIDWIAPNVPAGFTDSHGIAFANGVFIALPTSGPHSLARSTNGLDWTGESHDWFTEFQNSIGIESGDGRFLAWNAPSPTVEVALSTDGSDWQIHDTGTGHLLHSAAYGAGRWVFVGDEGRVITTTNFVNWNEQPDPLRLQRTRPARGHCPRRRSVGHCRPRPHHLEFDRWTGLGGCFHHSADRDLVPLLGGHVRWFRLLGERPRWRYLPVSIADAGNPACPGNSTRLKST